jgi:hypothetical protein
MHRSVDLTAVTPKAKLLREIADKLKSPKIAVVVPINGNVGDEVSAQRK